MKNLVNENQNTGIPSVEIETHSDVSAAPSFTLGPWNAKWNGVYGRYLVCGGRSNTCLATVGGEAPGVSTKEGRANARLIAAAPALYAALKAVANWPCDCSGWSVHLDRGTGKALCRTCTARAALKLVEGK